MNDPRPSHPRRWAILWVLCAALLIVVIDVTVLHIAAPAISADLDPTAIQLLWIIDVYSLVAPPLLLLAGLLGDRIGRRTLMQAGLIVFALASVAAALSPSASALIAARAVLGIGGAMVLPATMSIVRDVFRDRDERVRAVGIWSAIATTGAAIGPLVGGFLVEHFSWHAVFLINVPIVVLVLPFTVRLLPQSRAVAPPPWNTGAIILGGIGILGIAFGIKEAARYGIFSLPALGSLAVGALCLVLFCRGQLRAVQPLLNVRLFARREFAVAVAAVFLAMFGLVGIEFFGAQYLQLVLDLEPLAAAVRLMPLMASSLAGGLLAARVLSRIGTRWTITIGLGATAVGLAPMFWLGLPDQYILLWPGFLVIGFALEVALVAANDVIISSVPADEAGGVAAIEETAYELGSGFGVAVLGSVMAVVYSARLEPVNGIGATALDQARESISRAAEVAQGLPATVAEPLVEASRLAFVSGYHAIVAVSIVLIGVSALAASVLLRPGPGGEPGDAGTGPQELPGETDS
ncbi:MAG: MFS transporter [Solirubrobacterales bacterium]|nr:MFS transporter [Solirubrobacterales bacterium]